MKQIITAKLKLSLNRQQHILLRNTTLAYRDDLNFATFENKNFASSKKQG